MHMKFQYLAPGFLTMREEVGRMVPSGITIPYMVHLLREA